MPFLKWVAVVPRGEKNARHFNLEGVMAVASDTIFGAQDRPGPTSTKTFCKCPS